MGRSIIVFPMHELINANIKALNSALSAAFDLDMIGEYAFAAWTDYTTSSMKRWSYATFDPMDVIVESIYEELEHRKLLGTVLDVHMPWYELIIPDIVHLAMCMFLTITDYISKYHINDHMSFNFVTANECDFIISF